jgi:hypothetical protein
MESRKTHLLLLVIQIIAAFGSNSYLSQNTQHLYIKNKMNLTFTIVAFAALHLAAFVAPVESKDRSLKKGSHVEGEATIKKGDCKMECEWKALEGRRLIRANRVTETFVTVGEGHRRLGVALQDVECKVIIGDNEFGKVLEFPTGWELQTQKADGVDDYYGFFNSFTV